jgi:hypothetical protein
MAAERNDRRFEELKVNLDAEVVNVANAWLKKDYTDPNWVGTPKEKEIPQ